MYLLSKNLPPIAMKVKPELYFLSLKMRLIKCLCLQEVLEELRPVMQTSKNSNHYHLSNFEKDTTM